MLNIVKRLLYAALLLDSLLLLGQCPFVDFSIPPTSCLNEYLNLENLSSPSNTFEWDFCSGDLSSTSSASGVLSSSLLSRARSVKVVQAVNKKWYGFAIDQVNNKLLRFDFGLSLTNAPTITDLGNPGNHLQNAFDFLLLNEQGNWFALVANTGTSTLLKWQFGTDLESIPTSENMGTLGVLSTPNGISKITTNGVLRVYVTNGALSEVIALDFGNSINNTPASVVFAVANGSGLRGISFVQECNNWFGLITSYNNSKLFYLDFDNGLDQLPMVGEISTGAISMSFPASVSIAFEGGIFYAFIQSAYPGNLYKVDFGPSIIDKTGSTTDLGNLSNSGASADNFSFALANHGTDWFGFFIDNAGSRLMQLPFSSPCSASTLTSSSYRPQVSFTQAGNYKITLVGKDASNNVSVVSKDITIGPVNAPDITFISQNICANNDINFTSQNTSGNITDYNWDFGDTNTSMLQNPTHQYAAAADYPVSLQVTASNGCNNLARDTITVYNEPTPNFNLPAASPICSNQEYLFTNNSTFDVGSNPTWSWEVNGVPVSTDPDLLYTIPATVMQDIKLIASIPGCENEITQTINTVEDGPLADFTFTNDCEDKAIEFTNTTTGTVTSYLWDFGDGNSSTETNASNTFVDYGQFNVNLVASNIAGCVNNKTKPITIYSKPVPDFSIDLPPFSCSGSLSQFNDLTPNPPDSNLDSWDWSFGDPLNGTSQIRNAQYTYALAGDYNVNLDVTTNFGCTESIQKLVTILPSPSTDFTFNPACVNQATAFTPTSTTGINSWQWNIGTASYTQQNPIHVFGSPSTYNAQLTAIGSNGCLTVVTKAVVVPNALSPNFSSSNNCAQQSAMFMDLTPAGSDPVAARLWEFGTLGTGTGSSPSFIFPAAGAYPTKMTVTSTSGCKYAISKNVSIASTTVPTFSATPQVGTAPLTVQLSNTSSNVVSQQWTVNDPGNSTSTEATPSFTFTELGQYVVDLTILNSDGCSSTTSKIISVIVPSLDIELSSVMLNPAATGEVNILLSVKNNSNSPITNPKAVVDISGEALITEVLNTTIQPGQTYSQVLFTSIVQASDGVKYICVEMVLDGDKDLSNNKICINQNNTSVVLDPHPNPGSDHVNLDWIADGAGKVDVYIFDRVGRKVFDGSFDNSGAGLNRITVQLDVLSPGLYYILFSSNGVRKSFPYIVQR